MDSNITTKPARATVPFPAHGPIDEIEQVMARLRTVRLAFMADSGRLCEYDPLDAEAMIFEALQQLEPIRTFLAENDLVANDMPFLECRRQWFAKHGGTSA